MKKSAVLALAVVSALLLAPEARAQEPSLERRPARVTRGGRGASLSLPSTASARAILVRYLKDQGRDDATAESLVLVSEGNGRSARHARFEQRVGALPVFGTYAKAALNARGELVSCLRKSLVLRQARWYAARHAEKTPQ